MHSGAIFQFAFCRCLSCLSFRGVQSYFQPLSHLDIFWPAVKINRSWLVLYPQVHSALRTTAILILWYQAVTWEYKKKHSISINYHGTPGNALLCSSSIMLESTPINYLNCGWTKPIYFAPVLCSPPHPCHDLPPPQ